MTVGEEGILAGDAQQRPDELGRGGQGEAPDEDGGLPGTLPCEEPGTGRERDEQQREHRQVAGDGGDVIAEGIEQGEEECGCCRRAPCAGRKESEDSRGCREQAHAGEEGVGLDVCRDADECADHAESHQTTARAAPEGKADEGDHCCSDDAQADDLGVEGEQGAERSPEHRVPIKDHVPVAAGGERECAGEQGEGGQDRRPPQPRCSPRHNAARQYRACDCENSKEGPRLVHRQAGEPREKPEHEIPGARIEELAGLVEGFDEGEVALRHVRRDRGVGELIGREIIAEAVEPGLADDGP